MGNGYEISVPEVLRVVASLDGLLATFRAGTQDVAGVPVPGPGYGQVGTAAAGASTAAQQQLTVTLQALGTVLQQIGERVEASAKGYDEHDRRIAEELTRMATAEPAPR